MRVGEREAGQRLTSMAFSEVIPVLSCVVGWLVGWFVVDGGGGGGGGG